MSLASCVIATTCSLCSSSSLAVTSTQSDFERSSSSGLSTSSTASRPRCSAFSLTTGARSKKRFETWKAMTPSRVMCLRYTSIASVVSRWIGIESLERVNREDIERLSRLALERESGVAERDLDLGLAVLKERELPPREIGHLGIDVEEMKDVAAAAVGGQGSCAQADDANAPVRMIHEFQHDADAARPAVVARRLAPPVRCQVLLAMEDHAVDELPLAARLIGRSEVCGAEGSVEIALDARARSPAGSRSGGTQ